MKHDQALLDYLEANPQSWPSLFWECPWGRVRIVQRGGADTFNEEVAMSNMTETALKGLHVSEIEMTRANLLDWVKDAVPMVWIVPTEMLVGRDEIRKGTGFYR
jgi:hypothetical protein